jgi:hypothetical protein
VKQKSVSVARAAQKSLTASGEFTPEERRAIALAIQDALIEFMDLIPPDVWRLPHITAIQLENKTSLAPFMGKRSRTKVIEQPKE